MYSFLIFTHKTLAICFKIGNMVSKRELNGRLFEPESREGICRNLKSQSRFGGGEKAEGGAC